MAIPEESRSIHKSRHTGFHFFRGDGPLCDSNYYGEDINWEEDEPASSDPSYEGEGITWY